MKTSKQDVLVLSSNQMDHQFVQYLLCNVKHRLQICPPTDVTANQITQSDVIIVCHRACEQEPVPYIPKGKFPTRLIILSDRHDEKTIVDALEDGAHHYFNINEPQHVLSERLAAAMRDHNYNSAVTLHIPPFKFFREKRKVTCNDNPIHLSPREFALAYFLFSNTGRVVLDSELMISIWTLPSSMDSRRIDTAICRIRKKMNL